MTEHQDLNHSNKWPGYFVTKKFGMKAALVSNYYFKNKESGGIIKLDKKDLRIEFRGAIVNDCEKSRNLMQDIKDLFNKYELKTLDVETLIDFDLLAEQAIKDKK